MNELFLGHLSVFAVAALLCFASVPRALTIRHRETREGFVAILVTCGLWALGYLGYFLLPTVDLKVAAYLVGLVAALGCVGAWLYFSAAYTGRSPRNAPYRRSIVGVFLLLVLVKVTNPLHRLYFTTEWVTEPFPHLALHQGVLHWLVLAFAYVVIAVSFFMLLERFYYAGASARPLVALVGITALPVVVNVLGATGSSLLPIWYEPIGVAVFAVGTLFVYFRRFEAIRFTGDTQQPAILLDQDGELRDANQAARRLFPALEGARGQPLADVLPDVAATFDEDEPDPVSVETDGEPRYYHVSTSPITAGQVVTGHVVAVSDVTERERYRRQLESTTEQLEALTRLVRHDIRNDMAVVSGWIDTLPSDLDDPGGEVIERVRRKSDHVIELTDQASEFLEAMTGAGRMATEPVDLRRQLEEDLEAARETHPDAEFRVGGDLPDVTVAANELLSSVFRNLLANAVNHNDQATPTVTVGCEVRGDEVRVRVADDGPGVPDARKEQVFGKGEKGVDSAGTGIGLYLVRTLVERYDGRVWVEDNEPTGAAFVVELPVAG